MSQNSIQIQNFQIVNSIIVHQKNNKGLYSTKKD